MSEEKSAMRGLKPGVQGAGGAIKRENDVPSRNVYESKDSPESGVRSPGSKEQKGPSITQNDVPTRNVCENKDSPKSNQSYGWCACSDSLLTTPALQK